MKKIMLFTTLFCLLFSGCSGCGEKEHTCSYQSTILTQATCENGGEILYTCSCGESYIENIEKLGHNYIEQEFFGDCETWGEIVFSCTRCESSYSYETYTAHYLQTISGVKATCITDGVTDGTYCTICGNIFDEQESIIATGHTYINGECVECGKIADLEYTLSDDGSYYIVAGVGTCKDTEIFIGGRYNGLPITTIGENAFLGSNVENVTLGYTITKIEDYAFSGSLLKQITFSSQLTYIGEAAFSNCVALCSVEITENVTYIGARAFYGCTNLISVTFLGFGDWMVNDEYLGTLARNDAENNATILTTYYVDYALICSMSN